MKRISYAPSKTPYAIDWSRFESDSKGWARVPAIWVTRKDGVTRISEGHLQDLGPKAVDEFIERLDGRYGGRCDSRWDGYSLWTFEPASPDEVAEISDRLDAILESLPEIPEGYDGWWTIKR